MGLAGVSASFTTPLRRSRFGPCSERSKSRNMSNMAAGVAASLTREDARTRSWGGVDAWGGGRTGSGVGVGSEPALDGGMLASGIEQAAGEEALRRCLVRRRIEDGRGRIEHAQTRGKGLAVATALRRGEEIGLGEHDPIGDRDLL